MSSMNIEWILEGDGAKIPYSQTIEEFLADYIGQMEIDKNPYLKELGKDQELYLYLYTQPDGPIVREDHGHELRQYTIPLRALYSTPELTEYDVDNRSGNDIGVFEILQICKDGVKRFEMVLFKPEIFALKDKKYKTPNEAEKILVCDPSEVYDPKEGFKIELLHNNMYPFNDN
ncbi:MAG: hypothetical protein ABIG84_06810 [archaeon]